MPKCNHWPGQRHCGVCGMDRRDVQRYHGDAVSALHELQEEVQQLRKVAEAALALTEECKGGELPPSLGALARLASALSIAWQNGGPFNAR